MGLELFSPDDESSAVVTAILVPDDVNAKELVLALRDRHGITVAGGHGDMATRLFRIGHIGWFDVFDITTALAAVELVLADMGAQIERGAAVTRALEAYAEAVAAEAVRRVLRRVRESRSRRPGSSSCAPASTSMSTATPTSRRSSGSTTAIVIRSATTLTADLIDRAERLKVIGRAGVGVDNVDVDAATRRGIVVANAPESTVVSAAEQTIGLLVALGAEHPAGARGAQAGPLGAVALERHRARRQDAGRRRVRADRPAGVAAGPRSRHARRRLRPVRLGGALPRARRRARRDARRRARCRRRRHAALAAQRRDTRPDRHRRDLEDARRRSARERGARRARRRGGARGGDPLRQARGRRARRLLARALHRAAARARRGRHDPASRGVDRRGAGPRRRSSSPSRSSRRSRVASSRTRSTSRSSTRPTSRCSARSSR